MQYKEYATHLDHHLKDACSRSADFVARQAAYGEALGAFATQAASMSKYEEGDAAQAFLELNAAASAVAGEHSSATNHMNRCVPQPPAPAASASGDHNCCATGASIAAAVHACLQARRMCVGRLGRHQVARPPLQPDGP